MGRHRLRFPHFSWLVCLALLLWSALAVAEQKVIVYGDVPAGLTHFEVRPDGERLYFAANSEFLETDQRGAILRRFASPSIQVREMNPLPDGRFITFIGHASGCIALHDEKGVLRRRLASRAANSVATQGKGLFLDPSWANPNGGALDLKRQWAFALDCHRGVIDGAWRVTWSRIAIFDFSGTFVRSINLYADSALPGTPERDAARDLTYTDIEVDPARERIYATTSSNTLLAFDYQGQRVGEVKGIGGVAVLPDGRIAVGATDWTSIAVYSPTLELVKTIPLGYMPQDLEADDQGRLYATGADAATMVVRFEPDLTTRTEIGPEYLRLTVQWPDQLITAGVPFTLPVSAMGRPTVLRAWHVLARASDGHDLRWHAWPSVLHEGKLQVTPPADAVGTMDVLVKYGEGPVDSADRTREPSLARTLVIRPAGATASVAVFTAAGRRYFRQGEAIPVQITRRSAAPSALAGTLALQHGTTTLATFPVTLDRLYAGEIPGELTRRLAPGAYQLVMTLTGYASYPCPIGITAAAVDSPLQRVIYTEFARLGAAITEGGIGNDLAEQMAYLHDYTRALRRLGFTRETTRTGAYDGWLRGQGPAGTATDPALAPAEYYQLPNGRGWAYQYFLDEATGAGVTHDRQLLAHCAVPPMTETGIREVVPEILRSAQALGRYPAFYGFNYNDEIFPAWGDRGDVKAYLDAVQREKFPGQPRAAVWLDALQRMYTTWNSELRRVAPNLRTTATPMWQYPAVEGSYAPTIYQTMTESYSHFLSEGYHLPWYPAHSVEMLKRPGLPIIGVFEPGYWMGNGDLYLKNTLQVLGRGVQGVGTEHTKPFREPAAADAYRVANWISTAYGPIFAQVPPANEGAILYSYTQDVTESRVACGTPHWERVFATFRCGLMAGVPMSIIYEEDVTAGWLLVGGRPRVPLLVLAGITKPLPDGVQRAITAYQAAGGTVILDADAADVPRAVRMPVKTDTLIGAVTSALDCDAMATNLFAPSEALAGQLRQALAGYRRYPVDTSSPWVAVNHFDGGAIRYLLLSTDMSPLPWDQGAMWSLGTVYNGSWVPRQVTVTAPAANRVVIDVFEHAPVRAQAQGGRASWTADMRTFPGRLYAVAPALPGVPVVKCQVQGDTLTFTVRMQTADKQPFSARIPLRLRLRHGDEVAQELYRGTEPTGVFYGSVALPVTASTWTLEVTELLTGKAAQATVTSPRLTAALLKPRPTVEVLREAQLRSLLAEAIAHGGLTLLNGQRLSAEQQEALRARCQAIGLPLRVQDTLPAQPTPGIYLAVGDASTPETLGALLATANERGLFPYPLTPNVPGAGRGLVTAVFAPRGDKEHCIAVIGGDSDGLANAVAHFIAWIGRAQPTTPAATPLPVTQTATGTPVNTPVARVSELVGPKLTGIRVAADGRSLAVSAFGYQKNLLLLRDQGTTATVGVATRIGQARSTGSLYISRDGAQIGASSRVLQREGELFHLVDTASGQVTGFAAFGEKLLTHEFGVSADGGIVLAPGTYGVTCFRRTADGWQEAWANDYWKEYPSIRWPVSGSLQRIPFFKALIPQGADYGLVCFGEISQTWMPDAYPSRAWVAAYALSDGQERWRINAPIDGQKIFPEAFASADGARVLFRIQIDTPGGSRYRYLSIAHGTVTGSWESSATPQFHTLANGTGAIATLGMNRLLEIRAADGALRCSRIWPAQPVSAAFTADGQGLLVADDAGMLTWTDLDGTDRWQTSVGSGVTLACSATRVYTAGWDGRVHAYDLQGSLCWTYDCTAALAEADPLAALAHLPAITGAKLVSAKRQATTSPQVPTGTNLLANGTATLTVGGTRGWKSSGTVTVKAAELTNGRVDDVVVPWMNANEVYWNSIGGRPVWAEITFPTLTRVSSLTVYENPAHMESYPVEGLVQYWHETEQVWETAAWGGFLTGPVNTYALNIPPVKKIRYLPWNRYYQNFYTSEIEVRGEAAQ